MIETQAFPIEIKDMSETGEIVGLASVYSITDRQGEAIAPGAFRSSIERMTAAGRGLPMLREHRPELACGVWTGFADDGGALRVTGRMLLDTDSGREAHALVKGGALGGLSVGFRDAKRTIASGRRIITEGDLLEVSLVAIPANAAALIEAVKSTPGRREIEQALKAAGMSNRQAKAAAAAACKAITTNQYETETAALAAMFAEARQQLAPFILRNTR